ncbi:response regulator [Glycomyces mayteni]|uniref:Response regulator n=1 Tax=Glycomyces mayteni TaxID=543887 RepID=A0ABW2DAG5_9ACTN
MIRVLLADDEAMIRAGVAAILGSDPGIEVVAEAGDGAEAVELVRAHRPDVAVLDIRMPRLDGLSAAVEIRGLAPATAVVMLTTFDEDEYVMRALGEGASGFMLKAADPRELIFGVKAVAEGAAYLSPRIAQRVIAKMGAAGFDRPTPEKERIAGLTPREREVLGLLGEGLSNYEIGKRLFMSEGTVKGHMTAIFTRLGIRNRVQAAVLAYEAGLVARP